MYLYITIKMNTNDANKKYHCMECDFSTTRQSNWDIHLATKKHLSKIKGTTNVLKTIVIENSVEITKYSCACGTSYKHMSSLCKHRKLCEKGSQPSSVIKNMEQTIEIAEPELAQQTPPPITSELIMEFMKQSKDMQNLLIEQNRELQSTIVELSKKQAVTNIQNNNITNNNFNLNLFLNEQCKDAINITDFIESIKLTVTDLEATGRLGYVPGISRILINKLKELDVYTRPLHCTDLKRETVYIKDKNSWEKETVEKNKFKNIVKRVAKKNLQQLPAWQAQNPDFVKLDTPENNDFLKISLSSLGSEDEEKDMNKIMRNVLKEIVIEK
jgi:hypothetical protein